MAYAIKRKPKRAPRESVLDRLHVSEKLPHVSDTAREGAAEVTAKFKSDISRAARFRRAVSLKETVGCITCDATGRVECAACAGTGEHKLVIDEGTEKCGVCEGSAQVSCVECMGTGALPNVHRKKLLWMLAIGGVCWAFILFELWGGDILPEQRSRYLARSGGGGAVAGGAGHAAAGAVQHTLSAAPGAGERQPPERRGHVQPGSKASAESSPQ